MSANLAAHAEKRHAPRVQFFLLHQDHQNFPIWFFQPENAAHEIAAVLVDASAGGVQLMVQADTLLDAPQYRLTVWQGQQGVSQSFNVTCAWTDAQPEMFQRYGFRLEEPETEAMQQWLHAVKHAAQEHDWLRCTLFPLQAIH